MPPQLKEPLPDGLTELLDIKKAHRIHALFSGTRVLQHTGPTDARALRPANGGCVCVVLRTSFTTSQGKLIRTIMCGPAAQSVPHRARLRTRLPTGCWLGNVRAWHDASESARAGRRGGCALRMQPARTAVAAL